MPCALRVLLLQSSQATSFRYKNKLHVASSPLFSLKAAAALAWGEGKQQHLHRRSSVLILNPPQ